MNDSIVFWHWWAFGVFLLIVELLAPGMFFIWMAESAFITGIIILIVPAFSFEYQLIAFSLISIFSIAFFRRILKRYPIETDRPLLNQRAAQYIGRTFTLDQPMIDGHGKIRVDDTIWKIQGDDGKIGDKIRVIAAEGIILKVEKIL